MKLNNILVFLILASTNLYAKTSEDTNKNVDRACLKRAVTLVNQLKSDVYVDMDSIQSNKILKLATATCKGEFNQTETRQSIAAVKSVKDKESDYSILDILSKDVERKPGNDRLKRLKK